MIVNVSFWLFAALTGAFALVFLLRLLPSKTPVASPPLPMQSTLQAMAVQPNGSAELKALADAISAVLGALGDFGEKIDKLGPSAILAVFTVFFALLTFATAWLSKHA